jgi:hypothetical protein
MYEDATREKAPTPPPPDPPESHEEEFSAHTQVADLKTVLWIRNDFISNPDLDPDPTFQLISDLGVVD